MISRHWIGTAKQDRVADYLQHLDNIVIPGLLATSGVRNAYYLKRQVKVGVEFLVITEWEDLESIILFAGPDYDKSVVDEYAKSLLLSYEERVRHYTIPL
jgi:hypothetical protein